MESKYCYTSTRFQCIRKFLHKFIKYFKFPVHINTQSLKCPLACFFNCNFLFFFRKKIQCFFYNLTQFGCRINTISFSNLIGDCFCQFFTVRFIRVLIQHSCQFFSGNMIEAFCRADSLSRIQTQIQGAICFKGKASLRVVNLHRRNT